ncbi:MAG: winged helix-turn-helix domain-containing protein [Candidatus Korobacteraceae bacterium]|jgi:DNA-binding winged helix-turn-helix (wHTH) protein
MTQGIADRVFRFGAFEVNEATGELRKHGIRIKLHSQPFQILVMLLERPSQLVTREEMRQRLWGEDTFVDFDHGLNTAVNKLREALGDLASQPRHVETVSGKGYRFIAPVTLAAPVSKMSAEPVAVGGHVVTSVANSEPVSPVTPSDDGLETFRGTLLAAPHELPHAPRVLVRTLLLLIQAMYLAFYLGALANLAEIFDIFSDARLLSPSTLTTLLVTTAVVMIPVRLFFFAAVAFDFQQLPTKFRKLFPVLLGMDLLWALSPFLLVHHVSLGLALGMTAALVYMPFAQRSLVLMYARNR